jgi:hypothetical protein
MTRRHWLTAVAACSGLIPVARAGASQQSAPELEARIARLIQEYGDQGFHRTGTTVDRQSGEWLADQVRQAGLTPALEPFALSRIEPGECFVEIEGRRIAGLPLFDGSFTSGEGMRGRIGGLAGSASIGLTDLVPNAAGAGPIGAARREHRHDAIVCVTRGGRPGLCASNADAFLAPFGPPVVQVSSEDGPFLAARAEFSYEARVVATAQRVDATAFNVTARIRGQQAERPLVVMTPRSGWYACASERGGGIAVWLELMRALSATRPPRDVYFVASSGHELGHLGIDAYIASRPALVKGAVGWIHLGANIGAAVLPTVPAPTRAAASASSVPAGPGNSVQASDDEAEAILARALSAEQIRIARRVPRGTVPAGEAEAVHRGGGRYMSAIGANAWFHNPDDKGLDVIDPPAIARFARSFTAVARAWLETSQPRRSRQSVLPIADR